jgi:hypothetical protein
LRATKTTEQSAEFSINVGGRVRLVAQGEWLA